MPGKNKPKRLDRNRSWRVARRKKKRNDLINGNSRNRKPRPKNKGVIADVVEKVRKIVRTRNSVPSKLGTAPSVPLDGKVPSSSGKVDKKE